MSLNIILSQEELLDLINGLLEHKIVPNDVDFKHHPSGANKNGLVVTTVSASDQSQEDIQIIDVGNVFNLITTRMDANRDYTSTELIKALQQWTITAIRIFNPSFELVKNKPLLLFDSRADMDHTYNIADPFYTLYDAKINTGNPVIEIIPDETKITGLERTVLDQRGKIDFRRCYVNMVLSEVLMLDYQNPNSKTGLEYRWFILKDLKGKPQPLTVRYWLKGSVVTKEEYYYYRQMAIDVATGLVPDLAKLSSSYI